VSRALVPLLLALACGCSPADPCAGVTGACLAVHISAPGLQQIDALELAVTVGDVRGSATFGRPGPTRLPAATAIELGSSITAPVEIAVAVDAERSGAIAGSGAVSTTIAPGEHASVEVRLGAPATDGGAPDLAGAGCQPGGLYCGGDKLDGDPGTLYRCDAPAPPTTRGVCSAGCVLRPGLDDQCRGAGGVCTAGAFYCGGDKLDGDPQTLYKCETSGAGALFESCPNGCQVNPGRDDACK
jgi:hypothetical protein